MVVCYSRYESLSMANLSGWTIKRRLNPSKLLILESEVDMLFKQP